MLIQDRRNFNPPPWGFFGGAIDEGETPLQAVLRESKEELDLDLTESDVSFLATLPTQFRELCVNRHFFLYRTDQESFTVLEGAGAIWMDYATAKQHLDSSDTIDEIRQLIF